MSIFRLGFQNMTAQVANKCFKEINGFDRILRGGNCVKSGDGECVVEFTVAQEHTNPVNTAHGGFIATLVDSISTLALLSNKGCPQVPSITLDIHVTYLKSAGIGEEIVVSAKTLKSGKSLAFVACEIFNKSTGELLMKGSHTKYFVQPRQSKPE